MRHKVYTREHILKAAYEVIAKEGFTNFTARNVAKKMGVSTQPIYLEFKNMQDLKNTLIKMVYEELEHGVFSIEHTGDKLVDLALNYIELSQNSPMLFIALFVDESGGGKLIYDLSYQHFLKMIATDSKYTGATEDFLRTLHKAIWIMITGVAVLISSGIIEPTHAQILQFIERTIHTSISDTVPEK